MENKDECKSNILKLDKESILKLTDDDLKEIAGGIKNICTRNNNASFGCCEPELDCHE